MNTRRIIAFVIAFVLTIFATAMWSASTDEREGDPDAIVLEDSGTEAGAADVPQKKGGNKVVKVLAAPFKAFGKLFGRGDDKNKIHRMTEKDAERFESVGVTKIEDARTPTKKETASGSAREHLELGREYLLAGQYGEAVSELSMAVSLDPKLTEAHNLLGVAYDKKGFGDRAKESFERAVAVRGALRDAWMRWRLRAPAEPLPDDRGSGRPCGRRSRHRPGSGPRHR